MAFYVEQLQQFKKKKSLSLCCLLELTSLIGKAVSKLILNLALGFFLGPYKPSPLAHI